MASVLLFTTISSTAHADNKSAARDSFREGSRQFDLGEFKLALDAFKKAYLLYEEPAFLFNIAQCHRQLGDKPEAIRFYKTYLRKVPTAPNRAEVERIIATLEAEQEQATKNKPPAGTIEPAPPPPPTPPPTPTPQLTPITRDTPPRSRTFTIAGGALLGVGGAALILGGAFTGLAASANNELSNPPGGMFDPAVEDRRDTYQSAGVSLFIIGGAAAVAGIALIVVGRRPAPATTAHLRTPLWSTR
jgi:tetratricopeptide (TPR) repeat protein